MCLSISISHTSSLPHAHLVCVSVDPATHQHALNLSLEHNSLCPLCLRACFWGGGLKLDHLGVHVPDYTHTYRYFCVPILPQGVSYAILCYYPKSGVED